MNCCQKCFKDSELKDIIGQRSRGKCDFCGSEDAFIYNLDGEDENLKINFRDLLESYTREGALPKEFPAEKVKNIWDILFDEWKIFNLQPNVIYNFLTEMFKDDDLDFIKHRMAMCELIDIEIIKKNSILDGHTWGEFVEDIKYKNRFNIEYVNRQILKKYLESVRRTIKETQYYRARICKNKEKLPADKMGAPPKHLAKGGRNNPEGISYLYLTEDIDTAFHEIRASMLDYVTVGTFKIVDKLKIVDLTLLDRISPFRDGNFIEYAINMPILGLMSEDISKPLRPSDSPLDYLPTQYISDFIRSLGYDGIRYKSAMRDDKKEGVNLVVFDERKMECIFTCQYDIKYIDYKHSEVPC